GRVRAPVIHFLCTCAHFPYAYVRFRVPFGRGSRQCESSRAGQLPLVWPRVSITQSLRGAQRFVKWIREECKAWVCQTGAVCQRPWLARCGIFGTPSRKSCWHIYLGRQ